MLKPAILLLEIASGVLGRYLAHIPHRFFVWHIRALGWLFHTLDKRRYADAYANLEFVYGESLTHAQRHAIIRRCYDNFAFVLLESIRVVYLNPHTYAARFRFTNEHFITESITKDGGAVLISAHFGYWEAMATILPPRYRMCQMASLGRLTQFEPINHMIIKRRESNGVRMIDKKGAFKHLLKMYAQKDALVGILVDQNIGLNEGVEIEFFGKRATHTTIAIVETFAKIRELSRAVAELSDTKDRTRQKSLMRQGGDILADLLDDETRVSDSETTLELNFAVLKLKHTVKRKSKE